MSHRNPEMRERQDSQRVLAPVLTVATVAALWAVCSSASASTPTLSRAYKIAAIPSASPKVYLQRSVTGHKTLVQWHFRRNGN